MTIWGQLATTRVFCDLPGLVYDRFDRTETDSWGLATTGEAWTIDGTAAGWDVASGSATITDDTGDGEFAVVSGITVTDADVVIAVALTDNGGACFAGALLRTQADTSTDHYEFSIGNDATAYLGKQVADAYTQLASAAFDFTAGTVYRVRGQARGSTLRMKVWADGDTEPDDWLLEAGDISHTQGGVGVDHFGATLTETATFTFFEATQPDLVDITDYVLTVGNLGQNIDASRGRQTELSGMDPSRMSLRLNNMDGRFTPGNVSGAYWPYWKQGRQIVWTETIEYETFTHFDGFLEIPEVQLTFEAAGDPTLSDRTVTVTAVDQLARLDRSRPFVSTFAEWLRHNASPALRAYWPMGDQGLPFQPVVGQKLEVVNELVDMPRASVASESGLPTFEPSSADGLIGDDLRAAAWDQKLVTVGTDVFSAQSVATKFVVPEGTFTMSAGQVLTVVCFIRSDWSAWADESVPLNVTFTDPAVGALTLIRQDGSSVDEITAFLAELTPGALTGSVATGNTPVDRWTHVALRYGFNPDLFEVWVDDTQEAASVTGSSPTTVEITAIYAPGEAFTGSVAHLQVYLGDEDEFTFDDFTAQRNVDEYSLERQTTGDRIRTVAQYAGVPESALGGTDNGSSVMQAAQLAGQTAGQAMAEANDTERGRLFTSAGQIAFHSRNRINDV